jgi:acyl carrier protein
MGLDSVEILIAVEETFGITIQDGEASEIMTPADLISLVQRSVSSKPIRRPCLSQRAFHVVRGNICQVANIPKRTVNLRTRINNLFPKPDRSKLWDSFRELSGYDTLPNLTFGRGTIFSPTRVKDLVRHQLYRMADSLSRERDWTDEDVRATVRMIISEHLGVDKFADNDEFIRDLGMY